MTIPTWRGGTRYIENFAELAAEAARAEQIGAIGTAFLYRARLANEICLFPVLIDTSVTRFKAFQRAASGRPSVVMIGDDDYCDRGPNGWPLVERISRWTRAAMIHAAGAQLAHYELLVQAARQIERVVLVECSTVTAPAWLRVFREAPNQPRLIFIRPNEGQHPLPLARGEIQ